MTYPPELHTALSTLAKIEQSRIVQDDTPSGVSPTRLGFGETHPHVGTK